MSAIIRIPAFTDNCDPVAAVDRAREPTHRLAPRLTLRRSTPTIAAASKAYDPIELRPRLQSLLPYALAALVAGCATTTPPPELPKPAAPAPQPEPPPP